MPLKKRANMGIYRSSPTAPEGRALVEPVAEDGETDVASSTEDDEDGGEDVPRVHHVEVST